MKRPKLKYTSRPFPINEQNQAHWRLNLPHAQQSHSTTQYISNDCVDQELDVIIGKTKVASHDNELLENKSPEYLQSVGLGKEIRYDLASITVKFKLLKYKDQPIPIPSFSHSERAGLHSVINKIVMAAELLRAVCAGNSDHKYASLKIDIDSAPLTTYFDENYHKCTVPWGWVQRNIYKIHDLLTNCHNIITFSDGRRDDVIKMAALHPYLSPYNELRKRKETLMNFAMLPYDIQADTFTEKSSLRYAPAGIRLTVYQRGMHTLLNNLTERATTFSHFIIADILDDDYCDIIYELFKLAIYINEDLQGC